MLDHFVEILKINHWTIHEGNVFHKHHYPDIVLSERWLNLPELTNEHYWDTDLLGCYSLSPIPRIGKLKCISIPEGRNENLREGYIALYENPIIQCASKLSFCTKSPEDAINGLSLIVLMHEFAHYIVIDGGTSSIKKFNKNYFIKNYHADEDVKNFHEGLAQYFTYFIIKKDKDLLPIFLTLSGGQSAPYQKWKELCDSPNGEPKDIRTILNAILLYRELQTVCPHFKHQSFENFKSIIREIPKEIILDKSRWMDDEIISMVEAIKFGI